VPSAVRALRGATTLDADEPQHLTGRVQALLTEMLGRNGVDKDDLCLPEPATGSRARGPSGPAAGSGPSVGGAVVRP